MKDAIGQALAYVYARDRQSDADTAKVLTMDEARRIACNIAKLPELLRQRNQADARISVDLWLAGHMEEKSATILAVVTAGGPQSVTNILWGESRTRRTPRVPRGLKPGGGRHDGDCKSYCVVRGSRELRAICPNMANGGAVAVLARGERARAGLCTWHRGHDQSGLGGDLRERRRGNQFGKRRCKR